MQQTKFVRSSKRFLFGLVILHVWLPCAMDISPYSTEQEVQQAVQRYFSSWKPPTRSDFQIFGAPARNCTGKPSRLISMSLYGDSESNFLEGALHNARMVNETYPGWGLRIYSSAGKSAVARLRELGAEVVVMPKPDGVFGMFWRFYAASDPCVEHVIFRDTDCLLNPRERAAVDGWIESGAKLHTMIDSPEHANWAVQGGMWGIRGGIIIDMEARALSWGLWQKKLDDMHFLQRTIWPELRGDALVHSSVACIWGGVPFPPHPPWRGHVGQQVFPGPYRRSCPVRLLQPNASVLLAAAEHLLHNGLVYRYRAAKLPPSAVEATGHLAQALTHVAAALSCARWAAEADPLLPAAWAALIRVIEASAATRGHVPSCHRGPVSSAALGPHAKEAAGEETGAGRGGDAVAMCVLRMGALVRRLGRVRGGGEAGVGNDGGRRDGVERDVTEAGAEAGPRHGGVAAKRAADDVGRGPGVNRADGG